MRKAIAVQIGAGNIGRGFLGQIYFDSAFATTFVDTRETVVAALNSRAEYPLRLVGPTESEEIQNQIVGDVSALDAKADYSAAVSVIARAHIVGTSVGVAALPHVAPLLAAAINARAISSGEPLNILLCENQLHCASLMRSYLLPLITSEALSYFESHVGLVETVIGRMVPNPTANQLSEDPLLVVAEPYLQLPVAASMIRGEFPELKHIVLANRFEAYEAQKLFMHNAGHAALAYLGYQRGYTLLAECARDGELLELCKRALRQVSNAVIAAFSDVPEMSAERLDAYTASLLTRFGNNALGDTVARVAADPLRKLRPDDRLIGAVHFCASHGMPYDAFAPIVAASLKYDAPADLSAITLQKMRRDIGDRATLAQVCGLGDGDEFAAMILAQL